MLFLHSTGDEVIPISEGRRLYDAARGAKTFVEVEGGHWSAIERSAPAFDRPSARSSRPMVPGRCSEAAGCDMLADSGR